MKLDKPTQDGTHADRDRVPGQRTQRRVREFVAGGRVEPAARAEAEARHGPRSPRVSVDELVAKGRTMIDRMELLVRRIAGRLRR
jgi:hypothetical protein